MRISLGAEEIENTKFGCLVYKRSRIHSRRMLMCINHVNKTLEDFGLQFKKGPIFCCNTSAISLSKNPIQHYKPKHIELRHHHIRMTSRM